MEDAELERFAARQEKTIQILGFVDLAEVDPVYFERAYWLEPQERAERPYVLLRTAMEESGRAALGRFVLSTKEHLVLLRPTGGILALQTLYYPEDVRIRDQREIGERLEGVEVSKEELAMAEQLVEGLARPFEPGGVPERDARGAAWSSSRRRRPARRSPSPRRRASRRRWSTSWRRSRRAWRPRAATGATPTARRPTTKAGASDDQLSIEQSRLRGVQGGGEGGGGKRPSRRAKAPAKKSGTQRRRKAS